MRQQHAPTAVAVHTEIVEDLFGILACISAVLKFFIRWGNNLSAGETSYRYHTESISSCSLTIRFLEFLTCTATMRFLRFFLPGVVDKQGPVICKVDFLDLGVV